MPQKTTGFERKTGELWILTEKRVKNWLNDIFTKLEYSGIKYLVKHELNFESKIQDGKV
jgi:hypothetical protein